MTTDATPLSSEEAISWLKSCGEYFHYKDAGGEDRAHWANVYNAESCLKIAATIASRDAEIAALRAPVKSTGESECGVSLPPWDEYLRNRRASASRDRAPTATPPQPPDDHVEAVRDWLRSRNTTMPPEIWERDIKSLTALLREAVRGERGRVLARIDSLRGTSVDPELDRQWNACCNAITMFIKSQPGGA